MGWMIGFAQVIEFAGFWPLERDFLANSLESQAVILLARADGAGEFWRCDHASDGRAVSRICSAHGLTRSSIENTRWCSLRGRSLEGFWSRRLGRHRQHAPAALA